MATISSTKTVKIADGSEFIVTTELNTSTGAKTSFITDPATGKQLISPKPTNEAIAQVNGALGAKYPEDAAVLVDAMNEQSASLTSTYESSKVEATTESIPSETQPEENRDEDDQNLTESNPNATISSSSNGGADALSQDTQRPGSRPFNPLSEFSSYTYNLALYMCTPEAYNELVESGGNKPSKGLYLIAQSGGVNNALDSKRAPGFKYDLYIDDLKVRTITSTKQTNSSTNSVDMSFNIYEPYGFSLPTMLKNAAIKVQSESSLPGVKENPDAIRQQFLLEIKFYGYDKDGKVKTLKVRNEDATLSRIWPLQISKFSFKLSGKVTEYNIQAVNVGTQTAYGSKRGLINNPIELNGATVYDVLAGTSKGTVITGPGEKSSGKPTDNYVSGLIEAMNFAEKSMLEKNIVTQVNKYEIEIDSTISDATLVTKDTYNKYKVPVSISQSTNQSTTTTSDPQSVENTKRTVSVSAGSPVIKVIDQVIGQSSYVDTAFKTLVGEEAEPESESNSKATSLQWYNINPVVTTLGFDPKRRDFVYNVKYVVNPYRVPFVRSVYVAKKSGYYGAHKRYEYWYTGKNSEIVNFEQQFNNLYYIPTTLVSPNTRAEEPTAPGQSAGNLSPTQQQKAAEATASIRTSLYSIGDLANARMTILGDPDYLVTSIGLDNSPYSAFYGKDFTVNPNGGQVFIEINFYEGEDYNTNTGAMTINDQIKFNIYPEQLDKLIKGVVYNVIWVDSTFSKGKFTQELALILWNAPNVPTNTAEKANQRTESDAAQAAQSNESAARVPSIPQSSGATASGNTTGEVNEPSSPNDFGTESNTDLSTDSFNEYGETIQYDQGSEVVMTEAGTPVQDDDAVYASSVRYNSEPTDSSSNREEA